MLNYFCFLHGVGHWCLRSMFGAIGSTALWYGGCFCMYIINYGAKFRKSKICMSWKEALRCIENFGFMPFFLQFTATESLKQSLNRKDKEVKDKLFKSSWLVQHLIHSSCTEWEHYYIFNLFFSIKLSHCRCLSHLPTAVGSDAAHFDLSSARKKRANAQGSCDWLVLHVQELISLAYQVIDMN